MAEPAETGQVVETVTRKRVVAAPMRGTPEFWDYLQAIPPPDWHNHIIYLYRMEPTIPGQIPGRGLQVGKFVDNTVIPWHDPEEAESAIAQRYGGRVFRAIVKRLSQKITEGKILVDAPAKNLVPQFEAPGSGITVGPAVDNGAMPGTWYGRSDPTADVAKAALSSMAAQDRTAVDVAVNALKGAADVVQRMSAQPQAPAQDDLTRQFMAAMIQRMLAPPPDPLELLVKLVSLQKELSGGSNPLASVTDKFLSVAAEKVFNPAPAGPAVSAGAELVRQLPTVATAVSEGIKEWRMGMEAQARALEIARGAQPVPGVTPAQPQGRVLPPAPQPAPQASPQAPANGVIPMNASDGMNFLATKIMEIYQEPMSAEAAAEEVLDFIERLDRNAIPQLAGMGEKGLLELFSSHPILKPATANPSRLQEFIRAFIKFSGENDAESASKPN